MQAKGEKTHSRSQVFNCLITCSIHTFLAKGGSVPGEVYGIKVQGEGTPWFLNACPHVVTRIVSTYED